MRLLHSHEGDGESAVFGAWRGRVLGESVRSGDRLGLTLMPVGGWIDMIPMKKAILILLILAAVGFPPCDFVGTIDTFGKPSEYRDYRKNQGFVPLWEVGGRVEIRWAQLMLELGAIGAIALVLRSKAEHRVKADTCGAA